MFEGRLHAARTTLPDTGMHKPIPIPLFLDRCEAMGAFDGEKRWRSADGKRLYTWDSLHGEIEVFDKRGNHLGAADAVTGVLSKAAVRGRTINV